MHRRLDIAICGAGPAGLATALYMKRLGHNPVVWERFEAPRPRGSGLILQPTGQAVLADLGLNDAISALGAPIHRLRGTDARSGRVVLDVQYEKMRGLGHGLGIHRAALFGVLHEAAKAAGVSIRNSCEIIDLTPRSHGKRALRFADGERSEDFDLIVDCLGSSSPLKSQSFAAGRSRQLEFGALWTTLPWQDGEDFDGAALIQRYQAARVMIGVLPVGRDTPGGPERAAFFWSLKVSDYENVQRNGLDAWKQDVARHWPGTEPHLAAIGGLETLTLARYAHHTMSMPAGESLAFVGDSAHSTSPQLGQGANMALLDARALFVALRDEPNDVAGALAKYAALRRTHIRLYQAMSAMFTPFYQSDGMLLPLVRDFLVSYLARIPPTPAFLAALVAGSLASPLGRLGLRQ
jgi:2-polyprenyl-6-methoxyphenol hydroxylase-like FAD-dependent oxidoreductase